MFSVIGCLCVFTSPLVSFYQNNGLNSKLELEKNRRTELESDLKQKAQEIGALRSTEKQLAKVKKTPPFYFLSIHKIAYYFFNG